MTARKKSEIRYLTEKDIEVIHEVLSLNAKKDGEPIPPFSLADKHDIDALIKAPQQKVFGIEQYPTLEAKAAIIFYTVNKKHIFLNGNKRMSTFCLLVFIWINSKVLTVSEDELTEKALWLAKTEARDFQSVKGELTEWIKGNLKDLS